jgi:glycosyltransferase involved in cell wall biosynthesis
MTTNILTSCGSQRPPISAAIICCNEEKNIGRCLDALRWCEQIVVLDSGSSDKTLAIAKNHQAAKILSRPFDNYINQKNYSLDNCDHEWVLSVDADEVFPPPLIDEISGLPFNVAGYQIGRRNFLGRQEIKHGTWSPDYKLRLFRKSLGRWGGTNPHERVILEGETERLKTRMLHYSYVSREEFVQRQRKYTLMMVDYLRQTDKTTFRGEPYLHWITNFAKCYLLRGGLLDGSAGLFLAYHIANASYMKCALLGEHRKTESSRPKTIGVGHRVDDAHSVSRSKMKTARDGISTGVSTGVSTGAICPPPHTRQRDAIDVETSSQIKTR